MKDYRKDCDHANDNAKPKQTSILSPSGMIKQVASQHKYSDSIHHPNQYDEQSS